VSPSPVMVTHALGQYPVYVEVGLLGRLETLGQAHLGTTQVVMIADASVYDLLQTERLVRPKWAGDAITFPAGEESRIGRNGRESPISSSTEASAVTEGLSRSAVESPATSQGSWPQRTCVGFPSFRPRRHCSPW